MKLEFENGIINIHKENMEDILKLAIITLINNDIEIDFMQEIINSNLPYDVMYNEDHFIIKHYNDRMTLMENWFFKNDLSNSKGVIQNWKSTLELAP